LSRLGIALPVKYHLNIFHLVDSQSLPSGLPPSSPNQPTDANALRKFIWFGVILLVGVAGSWVASIYFFSSSFWWGFGSSLGPNPTNAQIAATIDPILKNVAYLAAFAITLELIALLILTSGVRDLAKVDRDRFGTPSILLLLAIAGLVLIGLGVFPMLSNVSSLISQAPATPSSVPSQAFFSALSSLIVYFVLLVLGGILALVGVIGGVILGLWRVGGRYDQTMIKIGAIFFIIPLLNIIAPVLLLVGAWEAKKQIAMPGRGITSSPLT
jgi:hypothetical protein